MCRNAESGAHANQYPADTRAGSMAAIDADEGSVDSIIDELGFGKYQLLAGVFVIVTMFINNVATSAFIFTARDTQYRCRVPGCDAAELDAPYYTEWLPNAIPKESTRFSKCARFEFSDQLDETSKFANVTCDKDLFNSSSRESCHNWIFGEGNTVIREFDLLCQPWRSALVGTLNGAGQFVCLIYLGSLSDKYGRRNTMLFTSIISGVVGFTQSFAPEYWSFAILDFLNTALTSGNYSVAFIMGIELFSARRRVAGTTVLNILSSLGNILLGLAAWQLIYWRTLLRVLYSPAIILLAFSWIMPESIRWLVIKGHKSRSVETINRAARWNKVELSEQSVKYLEYLDSDLSTEKTKSMAENKETVPLVTVLRSKRLLLRLVVCAFCWIVNFFVYFGLTLNAVSLSSDPDNVYLDYILVIAADLPSLALYFYLPGRLGRRPSQCAGLTACGVFCFVFAFIRGQHATGALVVYLIAKMLVSFSFSLIHFYTSEMFPTTLRHSCLGCCSMMGRIGIMIAPQVALLSSLHEAVPMVLYGVAALMAGGAALTFPETLNTVLPENIEEAENIGMKKKIPPTGGA